MDFFFCDDASQLHPLRAGMGDPLVAAGAVCVPEEALKPLTTIIATLRQDAGFPEGQPFKWSRGRELWMHSGLVEDERLAFFRRVLSEAARHAVQAIVVVEDTGCSKAMNDSSTVEDDVTSLLLERVQWCLKGRGNGCVIADRPGGQRVSEHEQFLANRLEMLATGTRFVTYNRILLFMNMPSRLNLMLQLADLVTGCTLAFVGGETRYSPPVFDFAKKLMRHNGDRIGGISLKIHPDFKYANLYHWLVGDTHHYRGNTGLPMPLKGYRYFNNDHQE